MANNQLCSHCGSKDTVNFDVKQRYCLTCQKKYFEKPFQYQTMEQPKPGLFNRIGKIMKF